MESILLIALLLGVFYLLLIRPQQRQRRHLAEVQGSLVPGAKVLTGSGLVATVKSVQDDEVELEVAPGVVNRYVRKAIVQIIPDDTQGGGPAAGSRNESAAERNPSNEEDGGTR